MNTTKIANLVPKEKMWGVGVFTFFRKTPFLTCAFADIRFITTNFSRRMWPIVRAVSLSGAIAMIFSGLKPTDCHAFTQVQISSEAPINMEPAFISATTNQFKADYFKNPLAANTYKLTIHGFNPNWNPPPTNADLLKYIVTVSSYSYPYGWAGGVSYQQTVEEGLVGSYGNLCDTATSFMLIQMTAPNWSKGTCEDVISTILNQLFQMSLSTYPVAGF